MAETPAVFVELVDLPADQLGRWRTWFDDVYLLARLAVPGVRAGRRGEGFQNPDQQAIKDADPLELVLFELASADVASSDAWRSADRELEAADAELWRAHGEQSSGLVYVQTVSTADDYRPVENAELLHGAFYEMPLDYQDEFNDWYNHEHIPIQLEVPGYLNARRFQCVDDPERFIAFYDVALAENTRGDAARKAMESAWSSRIRDKLARKRARRLFRIANVANAPEQRQPK